MRVMLRGSALLACFLVGAAALAAPEDVPAPPDEVADGPLDESAELRRMHAELAKVHAELSAVRQTLDRDRELLLRYGELVDEGRDGRPGPMVSYGSTVRVEEGDVVEEVVAFGDDVHVAGHVLGDATSFGGDVVVAPSGVVEGDAISFGGRVDVVDGGTVQGGRLAMEMPGVPALRPAEPHAASGSLTSLWDPTSLAKALYRRLILLLSFAGAGVLVVGLFPRRVGRIAAALEERPLRSAMVGTLGTGFLILFSLLFAVITFGLGLPVSIMVWALLGLAWMLGFVGLCQAVGDRLPFEQKPHGRWVAFLVGTILVTCAGSLPLVGLLVLVAASIVGIGAALSTRFGGT